MGNSAKKNYRKENRVLVTNISMFLMTQEKMKSLFWNIKAVEYNKSENIIKIGINTIRKLGTTLKKLRSLSKDLSNYLFESGVTIRPNTKIEFYVDREDEAMARIMNKISEIERDFIEFKN